MKSLDGVWKPLLTIIIIIVNSNKNLTRPRAATGCSVQARLRPAAPDSTVEFGDIALEGKVLKIQRINHNIKLYHIYLDRVRLENKIL